MLYRILTFPANSSAAVVQRLIGSRSERHFAQWEGRLNYREFASGIPAAAMAAAIVTFAVAWWVGNKNLSARYAELAAIAVEQQDFNKAVVCLERLAQEHPGNQSILLSLVRAYEGSGDIDRAAALLQLLAPVDSPGFRKAQLWMARRALLSPSSLSPDALRDVEARLIRLRGHYDVEPEVSALLADLYFQTDRGLFVENEPSLSAAAEKVPNLRLKLTQLRIGRVDPKQTAAAAQELAKHFRTVLVEHPDDGGARRALAQSQAILGDLPAATVTVREGLALQPQDERLKNMLAGLVTAQVQATVAGGVTKQQLDKIAREAVTIMARYEPLGDVATLQSARMLLIAGDQVGAEKRFRSVAENLPTARIELALLLANTGRKHEAERELSRVLTDYDAADTETQADHQRQTVAGIAAARLGDFPRAERYLKQSAAALAPARVGLIELYVAWSDAIKKTDPRRGLELLREALKLEPYHPQSFFRLLAMVGDDTPPAQEARRMLGEMVAQGDVPATAYMMLGTDAAQRGDRAAALKYLEQAARLAPDAPLILNNLAWTLAQEDLSSLPRALSLCDLALRLTPKDLRIRDTRGRILSKMGRWKDALADLELCVQAMDGDAEYHAVLAHVYEQLGLQEPAAGHLRRLRELQAEAAK